MEPMSPFARKGWREYLPEKINKKLDNRKKNWRSYQYSSTGDLFNEFAYQANYISKTNRDIHNEMSQGEMTTGDNYRVVKTRMELWKKCYGHKKVCTAINLMDYRLGKISKERFENRKMLNEGTMMVG